MKSLSSSLENKIKSSSSSSLKPKTQSKNTKLKIKIKPFHKPPTLPTNFYSSSTATLYQSLDDILHLRNTENISREELYTKVSDLCIHSFGPKLYLELVGLLDEAALDCVMRLANTVSSVSVTGARATIASGQKQVKVYFPTDDEDEKYEHEHEDEAFLEHVWIIYSEFIQFLNSVRAIFQPLDRLFLYIPPTSTSGQEAKILPRNDHIGGATATVIGGTSVAAAAAATTGTAATESNVTNNTSSSAMQTQTQTQAWNIWDVGIHCMYKHMSLLNNDENKHQDQDHDCIMKNNDDINNDSNAIGTNNKYSVLHVLKRRTIASLIQELKVTSKATSTTTNGSGSSNININTKTDMEMLHQPCVRNCVSIFRTFAHVSDHPMEDFLQELVSEMTTFLTKESQSFKMLHGDDDDEDDINNDNQRMDPLLQNHSDYDARRILHHIDARLKQLNGMTAYYALSSTSTSSSSSSSPTMTTKQHSIASTSSDQYNQYHHRQSNRNKENRILSFLVEKYLLTPHFNQDYLLHPIHLYSILDEEQLQLNQQQQHQHQQLLNLTSPPIIHSDAKLLFHLSKRVHTNPTYSKPNTNPTSQTITSYPGMEMLRQSFERYGKDRAFSIMRPTKNPNHYLPSPSATATSTSISSPTSTKSSVATSPTKSPSASAVKPPPQLTNRDIQNKIISNILNFKSHLEYLHKDAFANDEYFHKTIRKVLEDVLNEGGDTSNSTSMPQGQNQGAGKEGVLSTVDRRKKHAHAHVLKYSSHGCDGGKRIAELLAKYIDLRFKNAKSTLTPLKSSGSGSGSGGPDANADAKVNAATNASENANATPLNIENDMESFQNAVLDLFRHIQSKDVFEAFYRVDLAKRLLLNKSASIDVERTFVSKLKGECGTGYTSKMEGMFKDMELSREVMNNYSVYLGGLEDVSSGTYSSVSDVGVDMDVQVLTTGYWPSHPQHPSLILPTALEAKKNHFQSYYNSKYQGRRVAWQNSLGNCIVRAQFPKMSSPRELNVSLCQALVLMCFNVEDGGLDVEVRYTINDIMKKTGIADRGEAERVLQSLSMGRDGTQVLRRIEENKTVSKDADKISMTPKKKHKGTRRAIYDSDVFVVNANFTSNQRRIRITNIQMKETSEERVKTHEAVTLDRLYLIDAAIVRIMKARKTLDHRGLVGEVMIQLKFPASGVDIKKRIETLIEREYLQRVEGDLSRYNYLA